MKNNIKPAIQHLVITFLIFGVGFLFVELASLFISDDENIITAKKFIAGVCFVGFVLSFGKMVDKYKANRLK